MLIETLRMIDTCEDIPRTAHKKYLLVFGENLETFHPLIQQALDEIDEELRTSNGDLDEHILLSLGYKISWYPPDRFGYKTARIHTKKGIIPCE